MTNSYNNHNISDVEYAAFADQVYQPNGGNVSGLFENSGDMEKVKYKENSYVFQGAV